MPTKRSARAAAATASAPPVDDAAAAERRAQAAAASFDAAEHSDGSDSDGAPEEVSTSLSRGASVRQRADESDGRAGMNKGRREKNRAKQRRLDAQRPGAAPPAAELLPASVLAELAAAEAAAGGGSGGDDDDEDDGMGGHVGFAGGGSGGGGGFPEGGEFASFVAGDGLYSDGEESGGEVETAPSGGVQAAVLGSSAIVGAGGGAAVDFRKSHMARLSRAPAGRQRALKHGA